MATGLLFTIGSKGVKFTDEFYDVLRIMQGYKKGNHTRAKIYDSLLTKYLKTLMQNQDYYLELYKKN